MLLDYFVTAKEIKKSLGDLKLVICGGGDFSDLKRNSYLLRPDIIDIHHVSEIDKKRILKFARCLIQPSVMESFSIVLMEAWLLGTPALVNAKAEVTKDHVLKGGGGLIFSDYEDFVGTLEALCSGPDLRNKLGTFGKQYVETEYNWQSVLDRFDHAIGSIFEGLHDVERC